MSYEHFCIKSTTFETAYAAKKADSGSVPGRSNAASPVHTTY